MKPHALAEGVGFALAPLFEAVSFVGERGACFFALALMFMLFKRMRKAGACVFVVLCLGAPASNVVLKDLVTRPRPFENSTLYLDRWRFAGVAPEHLGAQRSFHPFALLAWSFLAHSFKVQALSAAVMLQSAPKGHARRRR